MGQVNTHIHTPYSFSAFDSIEQAVKYAHEEQIDALGISDFNTIEGFQEFDTVCRKYGIYPLFNIEFIAFSQSDKVNNIRWNDPKNPGIIYFCGKSLYNPIRLGHDSKNVLNSLWKGTQDHIWKVISKVNEHLHAMHVDLKLDYNQIRNEYAKNTVRERHVAKALYMAGVEKWIDPTELTEGFRKILNDPNFTADFSDSTFMQNEIRDRLLKTGKPAYVEENQEAFPSLDQLKALILEAQGIPCYPVLADDKAGLTECEKDVKVLADRLLELGICAVEFIPLRNSFDHLKNYVRHFHERNFCVTFGTEHNTPECIPLVPAARNGRPFDDELSKISYEGACILAAHQELHYQNQAGYVDETGACLVSGKSRKDFIRFGDEVIKKFNKTKAK